MSRRPPPGLALLLALSSAAAAQTELSLRDLPSGRGLVVLGEGALAGPTEAVPASLGASVAWVDLNGDGFDDLVLGAPDLPAFPGVGGPDDAGHAYVIFSDATAGAPAVPAELDLVGAGTPEVLDLIGAPGDRAGASVAAAGDVDGDGFDDLIVGAPGHDGGGRSLAGGAYLVFGSADIDTLSGLVGLPQLTETLADRATLVVGAVAFGAAGTSVGGGVDADADGFADVVIGAPLASSNGLSSNGRATVVYGNGTSLRTLSTVDLAALPGSIRTTVVTGAQDLQLLGQSVAGLGRFDATLPSGGTDPAGGDDVALGAPGTLGAGGFFAGAVYVLRGDSAAAPAATYTTDDFDDGTGGGVAGLAYPGASPGDQVGSWVGSAGDVVDGNGFVELLAAAPFRDASGRPDAGTLYLLPGRVGGADPEGFPLADIGSGALGLEILGAVGGDGRRGIAGAAAGDFDADGQLDLAVGFPGATVAGGDPVPLAEAGRVRVLDGTALQPPVTSLDLAIRGDVEIMRLEGEVAGALAGADLAAGDANQDGELDVAIGAPGAPSDLGELAFTETGRGHALYGPLQRVGAIDPAASYLDGPLVTASIFNLDVVAGVTVLVDGVPAAVQSAAPGAPGTVVFTPPAPLAPGAGASVDVQIDTLTESLVVPGGLTYTPLAILSGPDPTEVVPGFAMDFTGQALSLDPDLSVFVDGFEATITDVDPLLGTLTVAAPAGPTAFDTVDIVVESSNGSDTLLDAVTYRPFVLTGITPDTGPQTSGVYAPGFPVAFEGTPPVPVTVTMITSSGIIPPETTVSFGNDDIGFRTGELVSTDGETITVELPAFLLGDETVVDVRVDNDDDTQRLEDAFTYEFSDFTELNELAQPGFGPGPPRLLAAGDFVPSGQVLLFLDDIGAQTTFLRLFIGVDLFDPPLPFFTGQLGVDALIEVDIAPFGATTLAFDTVLPPSLSPEGASFFAQVVAKELDPPFGAFAFSNVLDLKIRFR